MFDMLQMGLVQNEKNNLNVIQNKIDSYEIEITKIENETKKNMHDLKFKMVCWRQ